jgi:hypothetical protein
VRALVKNLVRNNKREKSQVLMGHPHTPNLKKTPRPTLDFYFLGAKNLIGRITKKN